LKNGRSGGGAARISELVPTNRSMAGFALCAPDRGITDERFLHRTATKIAISQPVTQAVVEVIDVVIWGCWGRLRNAIAMIVRGGVVDTGRNAPALRDDAFGQFYRRNSAPCNRHPCRSKLVNSGRVCTNH